MSADDSRFLTRKQLAEAIQEETGLNIPPSRIDKAASLGCGPKPAALFGNRFLYHKEDGIAWALSLIRPVEAA